MREADRKMVNVHAADAYDEGGTAQRLDEGCETHGSCEDAVRDRPCCEKGGFELSGFLNQSCELCWWPCSKRWFFALGAFDHERQQDRHDERDDREPDQRQRADAADLSSHIIGLFDSCRCIVSKVGFANPGGAVEEEWKPACHIVSISRTKLLGETYQSMPRTAHGKSI